LVLRISDSFLSALQNDTIEWHRHALERMMERGISRRDIIDVLHSGIIIEEYLLDYPFPSMLLFGKSGGKPLHVVAAFDSQTKTVYVITAYFPDVVHFLDDYKTRRQL
jgi:hypothetical protein